MKDALKRAAAALGLASAPVQAETQDITTELANDEVVLSTAPAEGLEAVADPLAELKAEFDAQTGVLAEMKSEFESVMSKLATKEAELAAIAGELAALKEANAKAEADALAAKLAARHAAVVAALGTERADAFMAATKDMPDAQFNTVMAAMTASATTEATSSLFVEQGVDAQADVEALQAEAASNGTLDILKAKYQQPAAK